MAAAGTLLAGFRAGTEDAAGILAEPLVLVDADAGGDTGDLEVPVGFPGVVAAVAYRGAPPLPARGPDVALTLVPDAPSPWVAVEDLGRAQAELQEVVSATPGAAVALVQVLRAGRGRPVEEGLALESLAYSTLQGGPEFTRWRSGRAARQRGPDPGPTVLASRSGDVLHLTLNRPYVHNAYSARMRDELCEALAVAMADRGCRVLLDGAGPSFCSGGDLDEFGTAPDPVTAHLVRTGRSPARMINDLSDRIEARLHGSCAGSGIELPGFAGRVTAAPGTRIWLPELRMGLIPGAGGTVSLARRIGPGRTAWMALSGREIDETTALRWGLVDALSGQGE